jgi:hypothetical protein
MPHARLAFACILLIGASACQEPSQTTEVDPLQEPGPDAAVDASTEGAADAGAGEPTEDAATALPDARDPERIAADRRLEQSVRDHFAECGLIAGQGRAVAFDEIRDEHGRCQGRCLLGSRCHDVWLVACDQGSELLDDCLDGCATPEDGFACRDGSLIPHSFLCDLMPDCADGEDEGARCGVTRCDDGQSLASQALGCDFVVDCADGSDEAGCGYTCDDPPPTSTCGLWDAQLCDGIVQCQDGSDEQSCD